MQACDRRRHATARALKQKEITEERARKHEVSMIAKKLKKLRDDAYKLTSMFDFTHHEAKRSRATLNTRSLTPRSSQREPISTRNYAMMLACRRWRLVLGCAESRSYRATMK